MTWQRISAISESAMWSAGFLMVLNIGACVSAGEMNKPASGALSGIGSTLLGLVVIFGCLRMRAGIAMDQL